jgi:hypothetical protein
MWGRRSGATGEYIGSCLLQALFVCVEVGDLGLELEDLGGEEGCECGLLNGEVGVDVGSAIGHVGGEIAIEQCDAGGDGW